METSQLPTSAGTRLTDMLIKAERISGGRLGYSAYGPCLNSYLPNGVKLGFTIDPYIYFGSEIENPTAIENFTVRFAAYTEKSTPEGPMAVFLTNEEVEVLLNSADSRARQTCDEVKEMNGLELVISRKELLGTEEFICERERQDLEEACQQAEKHSISGHPSLCGY